MLFTGLNFEKYTTLDTDMLYTGVDIPVNYRYLYLKENSPDPIKSDWTELRPHEFAKKHNVRILKTSRQLGENPVEVVQDLPRNELEEYQNLPVKDFIFSDNGDYPYLTIKEQESINAIKRNKKIQQKRKEKLVDTIQREAKECMIEAINNEDKRKPLDDKALCKIINKELNLDFNSSFIAHLRKSEKILSHNKRRVK